MAQPTKEEQRKTRLGKVVPGILLPGVWYRIYFAAPLRKFYRVMLSLEERKEITESTFIFELKVPADFEFFKCCIEDPDNNLWLKVCSNGTYILEENENSEEVKIPVCTNGYIKMTETKLIAANTPNNWIRWIDDVPHLNVYFTRLDANRLNDRWDLGTSLEASHPGAVLNHARGEILHVAGFPGTFELPINSNPKLNPLSGNKLTVTWKEDLPYRFRKH